MPAGRPSKYNPAFCQRVIDLGKTGASVVEMACEIGVARSTLENEWPEHHEQFSVALTMARQHSQMWWEKTGRDALFADKFQGSVWSRSMAARFPDDWREKSERHNTGTVALVQAMKLDDGL